MKAYEVDGKTLYSLEDVAQILGLENVQEQQLSEGGEYSDLVSVVNVDDKLIPDDKWEEGYPQGNDTNENDTDNADDEGDHTEADKLGGSVDYYETVPDSSITLSYEDAKAAMPHFESLDALKGFIRDIDTPTLEYMAKSLRLRWKPTTDSNIHRMRIVMELQKYCFPELFKPKESSKKKKAKYGDLSTEELFTLAKHFKIEFKKTGNTAIDRMNVIMGLKKSGHLLE